MASPAARAASGSSVPDAFITGCSSSTAPTRVARSALMPPPRARRPRPGPRRRAARGGRRGAPRSRSRRRSRRPWAPRARPGTARPRAAQAAATARTRPSGPAANTLDAAREPRRQQVEHVGGRERDLALCRTARARRRAPRRRRGRPRAARPRGGAARAARAARRRSRRPRAGARPRGCGVEALAERAEHLDLGADLRRAPRAPGRAAGRGT